MRSKTIVIAGVFGAITGALGCKALFASSIPLYWAIGLNFLLYTSEYFSMVTVENRIKTATGRQMVTLYMLLKGIRLMVVAAVILVYMLAVKIETQRFVLVAAAIYCIYLLLNTLLLIKTEKRAKNEI